MPKNDSATIKVLKFFTPALLAMMLCALGIYELLPCVIASAVFASGIPSAAMASAATVWGTWALFGEAYGIYALMLWLAALILILMLVFQKPYRTMLVLCAMVISFAMLFFVILSSKDTGAKPFEEIVNSIVSSYLSLGKIPPYEAIYDLGLCFLIASGMFYAWLNLMITRIIANMSEHSFTIKHMARYELWQLSSNFNIGAIVITACIILLSLLPLSNSKLYVYAGAFIILLPLCVQGFCFISFLGEAGCLFVKSKLLTILIVIALFPLSLILLIVSGIIEQIFRFRQKALSE